MDPYQEYNYGPHYDEGPRTADPASSYGYGGPNYKPPVKLGNFNRGTAPRMRRPSRSFPPPRGRGFIKPPPRPRDPGLLDPPPPPHDPYQAYDDYYRRDFIDHQAPPEVPYARYGRDSVNHPPQPRNFRPDNRRMTRRPFRGSTVSRTSWVNPNRKAKPSHDQSLGSSSGFDFETARPVPTDAVSNSMGDKHDVNNHKEEKKTDPKQHEMEKKEESSEKQMVDKTDPPKPEETSVDRKTETQSVSGSSNSDPAGGSNLDGSDYCSLCKIKFLRPEQYTAHVHGMIHIQKMKKVNKQKQDLVNKDGSEKSEVSETTVTSTSSAVTSSGRILPQSALLTSNRSTTDGAEKNEAAKSCHCDICKITFERPENYEAHTRGMMHLKMLEKAKEPRQLTVTGFEKNYKVDTVTDEPEYLDDHDADLDSKTMEEFLYKFGITKEQHMSASLQKPDPAERDLRLEDCGKVIFKKEFHCQLCDVKCTGVQSYQSHLQGYKHKANVNAVSNGKIPYNKRKPTGNKIPVEHLLKMRQSRIEAILRSVSDEAVIGLNYITEFQRRDVNAIVQYVCNLCEAKCDEKTIKFHITGSKHRTNYMKILHQDVLPQMKKYGARSKQNLMEFLDQMSVDMEMSDGRGQVKLEIIEDEDPIPMSEIDLDTLFKKSGKLNPDGAQNRDSPFSKPWQYPLSERPHFEGQDRHFDRPHDRQLDMPHDRQLDMPQDRHLDWPQNRHFDRPQDRQLDMPQDRHFDRPHDRQLDMPQDRHIDRFHKDPPTHWLHQDGPDPPNPPYDIRDQDPHFNRFNPDPYREISDLDQHRRPGLDPYFDVQGPDEHMNRPICDPYLSEVHEEEHFVDSWSPEARLKRLEAALKQQNTQSPSPKDVNANEESAAEKIDRLTRQVKHLESQPFLTNEDVKLLALKKWDLNREQRRTQEKDRLVQKHQRLAALNDLGDRLSSFQKQVALDAFDREKPGGSTSDKLMMETGRRSDRKPLEYPNSSEKDPVPFTTSIDEVDLDRELWEDHLLREKLKIPFEYRPELDKPSDENPPIEYPHSSTIATPVRPECLGRPPGQFSREFPHFAEERPGYVQNAAATNETYPHNIHVNSGLTPTGPGQSIPSQTIPLNPGYLQKTTPNLGTLQHAPLNPGYLQNTTPNLGTQQNAPVTPGQPVYTAGNAGYPQNIPVNSWYPHNDPQNALSHLGLPQGSVANQPLQNTAAQNQSLPQNVLPNSGLPANIQSAPSQSVNTGTTQTTKQATSTQVASDKGIDPNQIGILLQKLSSSLITNEEEAAMALQVSNALTQALLSFRLKSLPGEADAATKAIAQIKETQKLIEEKQRQLVKAKLKKNKESLKRQHSSDSPADSPSTKRQPTGHHDGDRERREKHGRTPYTHGRDSESQRKKGYSQGMNPQAEDRKHSQTQDLKQQVPRMVPPPDNVGSLSPAMNSPTPPSYQPISRMPQYAGSNDVMYSSNYMPNQYVMHPPPAPPLPFTAPPEKPPPPPGPPPNT
ncbi:uncharacterized protein LOC121381284 [Gigantopelta aegis]|uniref:uncharacterized protein LOC121381284 n=1 Tax=Gigantopelta aegis TaxID=1735272 RepID=UPI001B8875B7|nr:uncharacterized protein LOC121381284 [Gigantopelta aegis]